MFRFTIRDLLLLTVIVALAVGWWLRERQLAAQLDWLAGWENKAMALQRAVEMRQFKVEWQEFSVMVRDDVSGTGSNYKP